MRQWNGNIATKTVIVLLFLSFLISSCSIVRFSGTMTRRTGEMMTDMSKGREDSFFGKMLGFGGRMNTAVGSAVEGAAGKDSKDGKDKDADQEKQSKTSVPVDASRSVAAAAVTAAKQEGGGKSGVSEGGDVSRETGKVASNSHPAATGTETPRSPAPLSESPKVATGDAVLASGRPALAVAQAVAGRDQVRQAQQLLKAGGYDPGPIDGAWGRQTKAALAKYQRDKRLRSTGTLDDATRRSLGVR